MSYEVGDVIMRPLPPTVETNKLFDYVATITSIDGNDVVAVTGAGDVIRVPMADATLVASAKVIIASITHKGVELCKRAT